MTLGLVRTLLLVVAAVVGLTPAGTAQAAPESLLANVVVIGVPGLRWSDVKASPELTALVNQAHVGSISVKTSTQQTCPIDGWLTVSAGTRAWGSQPGSPCPGLPAVTDGRLTDWQRYVDLQAEHHTSAELGRLGDLGRRLCGFGPGGAIAVAGRDGSLTVAGGNGAAEKRGRWQPAFDPAALAGCNDAVVDAGAMPLREGREQARERVAELVAQARSRDSWVLLVGISEEAAGTYREPLVAMQLPPDDGPRWLTSNSTRRPALIQLTDITATVLSDSVSGAPIDGAQIGFGGDRHTDAAAVIEDRLDANQRLVQRPSTLIAVVLTLVIAQFAALAWYLLRRSRPARRTFVATLLAQGGFVAAVFLVSVTGWWRTPEPGLMLYLFTLAICAVAAVASYLVLRRRAVFGLAALGYLTLVVDGILGTPLQVGGMFAQGPVSGGRFYGFGNSTFAIFAAATLVTAAYAGRLLLHRGRAQAAAAVLAVGLVAVIVDGAPGWGADFGGVISLTPAVLLQAWLTWRGRASWRALVAIGAAAVFAVAAFAVADYQRPPADRTHLGAFVARVLDGDVWDVFARKLSMSLGYLNNPGGWALLVGVLVLCAGALRPQWVPFAAYRQFAAEEPMARPTLLAVVVCSIVGMLLNDAGVTVPAILAGFVMQWVITYLVHNSPRRTTEAGRRRTRSPNATRAGRSTGTT